MITFKITIHRSIKGTSKKTLEKKSNHLLNEKLAPIINRVQQENGRFRLVEKDGSYNFEAKGYSPDLLQQIRQLLE